MRPTKFADIRLIIHLFETAFKELSINVDPLKIETMATIVHRSMDGLYRIYHGPRHILHLSHGSGAIATLAAIYHDVVQMSLDRGLPPKIEILVQEHIELRDGQTYLMPYDPKKDKMAHIVYRLFGRMPGECLNNISGKNEFLSSLVFAKEMEEILENHHIIHVICCIEATIPFRDTNSECFLNLLERLKILNEETGTNLDENTINTIIHSSVEMSNKDLDNFRGDALNFLDNTWGLLPETNASLRFPATMSIRQFRSALHMMTTFLKGLNVGCIFHSYKGIPEHTELKKWQAKSTSNINFVLRYLKIRLYSLSLLEAIAVSTGGDAPLSLFLGDDFDPRVPNIRLENYLPAKVEGNASDIDNDMIKLLIEGYKGGFSYNVGPSPLSAFLYAALGEDTILKMADFANDMFAEKLSADEYLKMQEGPLLNTILNALGKIVTTRSKKLLALSNLYR